MTDRILEHIRNFYSRRDYPALAEQLDTWRQLRPLAGTRLLDATPVYTNTLVKYLPLVAGGAELAVGVGEYTPVDRQVLELLRNWGFRIVVPDECASGEFDVIMDCAGMFADIPTRCGYVELTRSGVYRYRGKDVPVFFADAGRIKFIETTLGTGEGYLRAMKSLGYDFDGKRVLIFGGGKVGRGVAAYVHRAGAEVAVADLEVRRMPAGVTAIDGTDKRVVRSALEKADHIVAATGISGALAEYAKAFCSSKAVIANMGVEDEFGPEVPVSRVLNGKKPLNFILPEPTCLKYIDPTMALANAGALELVRGKLRNDINEPAPELEERILAAVRRDGMINEELKMLEEF